MRLQLFQENLDKGLRIVGRAVAGRTTLPVMSNVLLTTDGDRLKLSANNFELGINCWVGAKIAEAGAITLPARLLTDFVNSLPPERIDIELDEKTLSATLICGHHEATIKGISAEEFPVPDAFGEDASFVQLPADDIRQMIKQVAFAAATDESRPVFSGVLVEIDSDGQLTMAAADGFRLSVRNGLQIENWQPERAGAKQSVIIPARALAELNRLIADEDLQFAITKQGRQAVFATDAAELITSVIDGDYPDIARIIPEEFYTSVRIDTAQILQAAKMADLFARDSANIARLSITPMVAPAVVGKIHITANSAETGDNAAELDAVVTGDYIEIALNTRYMIDALSVMPERVELRFGSATQPVMLRPDDSNEFLHVIMPMHIQGGGNG